MNQNFIKGFIKAAQDWGFSHQEAEALLKEAGRGQLIMNAFQQAAKLKNKIPGMAMDLTKGTLANTKPALNKITDTADTLKSLVSGGVAPRVSKPALGAAPNPMMANRATPMHQQADYLRMLRTRMNKFKNTFENPPGTPIKAPGPVNPAPVQPTALTP
jgi:hypothetical protein